LAWAPSKVKEEAVLTSFGRRSRASSSHRNSREGVSTAVYGQHEKVHGDVAEDFKRALGEGAFGTFTQYVQRFDAHDIPFDGPTGIVHRVQKLLNTYSALDPYAKGDLMDRFVKIILKHA